MPRVDDKLELRHLSMSSLKGFSSFSLNASWRWRRCLHPFGDLLQLDNRTLSTSTTHRCATQLKWDKQMLRIAWPKKLLMALRMASKHLTRKRIIAIIAPDSDASSEPKIIRKAKPIDLQNFACGEFDSSNFSINEIPPHSDAIPPQ